MHELDIVIPVYNEGANIRSVFDALHREVRTPFRVLICYDRDDDNTLTALADYPREKVAVSFVKNTGTGPHAAVRSGFAKCTAPAIMVYMADDDYNCGIIDRMVARLREGNDVVAASRFVPGGSMVGCSSWTKMMITRVADYALFHFCRLQVHDATNGFRLFSRRLARGVELESSLGFTYSIELLCKAVRLGWGVAEVPAQWIERSDKPSRFKVLRWIPRYLRWLFYALATVLLHRGPETVRLTGVEQPAVREKELAV